MVHSARFRRCLAQAELGLKRRLEEQLCACERALALEQHRANEEVCALTVILALGIALAFD